MRSTVSPDGITQGLDAIKFDTRYGLSINHGVNRVRAGAMVNNEAKLVDRLQYGMYRDNIYAREKFSERFRKTTGTDFFIPL
jgi:hypothetical protein